MNNNSREPEPSYPLAALGGLFLGILGSTVVHFFPELKWLPYGMPVIAGFIAGVLGAYAAAEPYENLRTKYDDLLAEKAGSSAGGVDLSPVKARLESEALRLAKEAAAMGEDGIKVAEAAEALRKEASSLLSEVHGNELK